MSGTLSVDRINVTGSHGISNDGWFRNSTSGEGLYNTATTQYFYSDDDDYWNIAGGTGANGLRFRDEHAGSIRGYVYCNSSNQIGFLNQSGNWTLRTETAGITKLGSAGNGYQIKDGNVSNNLYILTGASGSASSGISVFNADGAWRWQIYSDGTSYGFLDANWGSWDLKKTINGAFEVDEGNGLQRVWNAGNDGSGSGLDADNLDGRTWSESASNSTIVSRNSSGYVFANFFNTTANDTGTGADVTRFYCSEDAYIRYIDKASMRSVMNVTAVSGAFGGRETVTTDTNYWVGSMGWGSQNFDTTVWDYGSGFIDVWNNSSGQPSGTSHWQAIQSMHYTNQSGRYGFRIACGAGNPSNLYVQGRWGNNTYGWHKLWNAVNDGSGSGLDADTLDGINSGSFLRSDANDNLGGTLSYTSDTARLQFTNSSYGQSLHIGGWTSTNTAGISRIRNSNDNLHIDCGANGGLYLNYYAQTLIYASTIIPRSNNTFDLGTSTARWRNLYINDLNLSNEGSTNDVDGTWGSYTIQEGAEELYLINKRNGKKYKFNLTEVS